MKSKVRNLAYLVSLLPAVAVLIGNLNGGILSWLNLFFILGILGLIEVFSPSIKSNEHSKPNDSLPDLALFLHCVFQTLSLSSLFYGIYSGILLGNSLIGAIISTGLYSGQGAIIVAHELIHKHQKWKRFFGKYLLFSVGNVYFEIHHLRIHHRYVGTNKDSATAKKNEMFYVFFLRTVIGQFKEAWQSESQRLKKIQHQSFSIYNGVLIRLFLQLIWITCLAFIGNELFVIAWISCVFVAGFLLEYVNYIEHYGLVRNENERVTLENSWQTDKLVSRFFLFDLNRHSDHHFNASKPYHTLLSHNESPVLPGGYASLILPALIPPWWFYLVNKRIPSK